MSVATRVCHPAVAVCQGRFVCLSAWDPMCVLDGGPQVPVHVTLCVADLLCCCVSVCLGVSLFLYGTM